LIGFISIAVAIYWINFETKPGEKKEKIQLIHLWDRFPKFVLGFLTLSLVLTICATLLTGAQIANLKLLMGSTSRWYFCMGFVGVGMESNFRELKAKLKGGKPIIMYIFGQTFDLFFTLLFAWISFGIMDPNPLH